MNKTGLSSRMRLGLIVIAALAILTAVEFWVAVSITTALFITLVVIAIIKTALIAEYFMHFSRIWKTED